MKNLLWIVLAAIVLIGGYVLVTGRTPTEMIDTADEGIEAPAVDETASEPEPADSAADEADAAADEAAAEMDAAADEAGAAVETATDDALETADDAMNAVEDTAGEVAADTEDAAADAAAGAEAAVDAMAEEGSDAMQAVDDAAQGMDGAADEAEADAAGPLSVENFDMQAAADMIDNSQIDDMQKTLLKATLKQAEDNPELLKAAVEQARAALGM